MTAAAKTFTRRVFANVWTFTVDPATGVIVAERPAFEAYGHRYHGYRHELHGRAGREPVAMLREVVVMLNRLRNAASIAYFPANAAHLEGRRGFANVNSCREARRVSARIAAHADAKAAA